MVNDPVSPHRLVAESFAMVALGRYLMGTRFEVVLADEGDPERLRAAGDEALDEVERIEGLLSLYHPDSVISELNAYGGQSWVRVPPDVFALLQRALALSRLTAGAFDITLLPLLRAWGFIGGTGHEADPADVAAARDLTGADRVELDVQADTVRFDRTGVGLDLGAVGKGYALDQAVAVLSEIGVRNALLHGGTSTVVALGAPDGDAAWNVAIRDPRTDGGILETVPIKDGKALSVSGAHGKAFTGPDGRVMGHVLDPRTGQPAQAAVVAAVVASDATSADALSTALLVLGREGATSLPAFACAVASNVPHIFRTLTLERTD